MAKTKEEKRKAKRKVKQKGRRHKLARALQREKADYLFEESLWLMDRGQLESAHSLLEKVVRLNPGNEKYLEEMGYLGQKMGRQDIELKALLGLYHAGLIKPDRMLFLGQLLEEEAKYAQAAQVIKETIPLVHKIKRWDRKELKSSLAKRLERCKHELERDRMPPPRDTKRRHKHPPAQKEPGEAVASHQRGAPQERRPIHKAVPEIPVTIEVDPRAFKEAMAEGHFTSPEKYELALKGYEIRFKETFENLISLSSLKDVRSLWYQEETAKKALKTFRGRALLADEVGLGKTIEALIVLKEYIQRGMVKSALILTPTPLVSQWKEELKVKFGLDFPSTDDPGWRAKGSSFWKKPFILASINLAKSKNNFSVVTEREYDMVIVDEAHHLKNRNTLNWKLVNALKKRFLLLLTATPVENNLMELYNLVTLLKPGQLKTASAFREQFMTRGDPTDPRNRGQLKELLGQVMIRNTRALARIDIPPRFAQTIRMAPNKLETTLYERISSLVKEINATNGTGHKLLLKNLLAEAGSSPRAVSLTFSRILSRQDMLLKHEKEIRSINNICRSLDETSKNRFLLDLIRSQPGKKIVFVKYRGTLEHVSEFLEWEGIPHALFHGQMDNRRKDEQIQGFREGRDILVTTEIGGEGRNLQFCHQMVNYDLPWNPMRIEQRIGRIHRIGQEKEVIIYNLCATGSVEDYILEILDKKINMFEMVIGEIDMVLGRIRGEREFSEMVFDIWVSSRSREDKEKAFGELGTRLKMAKAAHVKTKELDKKLFGENYEL